MKWSLLACMHMLHTRLCTFTLLTTWVGMMQKCKRWLFRPLLFAKMMMPSSSSFIHTNPVAAVLYTFIVLDYLYSFKCNLNHTWIQYTHSNFVAILMPCSFQGHHKMHNFSWLEMEEKKLVGRVPVHDTAQFTSRKGFFFRWLMTRFKKNLVCR